MRGRPLGTDCSAVVACPPIRNVFVGRTGLLSVEGWPIRAPKMFVSVCLAVCMLSAACASLARPPAENLAWERWRKCLGNSQISLKEIRADGEIWVFFTDASALKEWRECDRLVKQEQLRRAQSQEEAEIERLISQAKTEERAGQLDEAAALIGRVRRLFQKAGLRLAEFRAVKGLAETYQAQGRISEAVKTFEEALGLLSADDVGETYPLLRRLGYLHAKSGDVDQAIIMGERELALIQKAGQIAIGDGLFWRPIVALADLSWFHFEKGNYREALSYAEMAYARRERDQPIGSFWALILTYRGLARYELLDADGAGNDFREALKVLEEWPDRNLRADLHNNLGNVDFGRGNYQKAIGSYEQALRLDKELGASSARALHLANLGRAYIALNLFDRAHYYLDDSIDIARASRDLKMLERGLRRKSEAYLKQRDLEAAYTFARQALQIARDRGSTAAEGWVQIDIGYIQVALAQYERARQSFREALEMSERGPIPYLRASAIEGLGRSHLQAGEYELAASYLAALEAYAEELGPTNVIGWGFWYVTGQVREGQGRLAEAYDAYAESIRQIETVRVKLTTVEQRASYVEDKQGVYEAAVRVLFRSGRIPAAFEYAERSKGRAFLDLLNQRSLKLRPLGNGSEALIDEEAGLAKEIAQRQVEILQSGSQDVQVPTELLRRRAVELRAVEERWRDLGRTLTGKVRAYEGHSVWTPASVAEIQGSLPEGAGVLSYYIGKRDGWMFYVDRERFVGRTLQTSPEALTSDVLALRRAIMSRVGGSEASTADWISPARRLYQALVVPIAPYLDGKRDLIVAANGALHYVPFQALLDEDRRPLVERIAISMVPSASSLRLLAVMPTRLARGLGVANPAVPGLTRLPGAEEEVRTLSRVWPSELILDRAATKAAVIPRMRTAWMVHFATHAELDRFAPLQSSLRLTPTDIDDGRLTLDEIFDLDMSAELVVLAACDTGLGVGYKGERGAVRSAEEQLFPPGDELVGLSRAFFYAGTPSLVASLWPVEDSSTATLMGRFYENLKRMPKAEALRQAQLSVLRTGRATNSPANTGSKPTGTDSATVPARLSHPYFWAPFVFIGDGQSYMPE